MEASSIHFGTMQDEPVLHIPKLQYRTKPSEFGNSPRPDSISSASASFSSGAVSTAPTSPELSDHTPSPTSAKAALPNPGSQNYITSSVPPSQFSRNPKQEDSKRRKRSFFGFFSVKEPSQQAFEDYQRQMRRKGASKDGRLTAIGLPGVSSAKLPPTVPKVNSRWDGVPQAIKERDKKKQAAQPQLPGHTRSIWSSGSGRSDSTTSSTRSRSGSHPGGPQCRSASSLSEIHAWETGSVGSNGNAAKAQDKAKQPISVTSAYQPNLRGPQPPPLPPSVPEEYLEQNLLDIGALLGPSTGNSSPLNPPKVSPRSTTIVPSGHASSDFSTNTNLKTTTLDVSISNGIVVNSNGFNILSPPATAKRKGKLAAFAAGQAEDSISSQDSSSQSASKTETIPHRLTPLAHAHTSTHPTPICLDIAPWGDPPPTGKYSIDARSYSANAFLPDGAQTPGKKSRFATFGR